MVDTKLQHSVRILHVISGLEGGGAEKMLLRLVSRNSSNLLSHVVLSLSDEGVLGKDFISAGIPVFTMGMSGNGVSLAQLARLLKMMRLINPNVVQTWMFHADFIGGIVAKLGLRVPVVWNLRQSDTSDDKLVKRVLANHVNKILSYMVPDAIVCCGDFVREMYLQKGYSAKKLIAIPNGYDVSRFQIDRATRDSMRNLYGFTDKNFVVGVVGRFHPMKDHRNFVLASRIVLERVENAKFVFCGAGLNAKNLELINWIEEAGLPMESCTFLGEQDAMNHIYPMLDLLVSSSRSGEGFPNVVAEAMACGIVSVGTDVGGTAEVIGDKYAVVPHSHPELLAEAIIKIASVEVSARFEQGKTARNRIVDQFSIDLAVSNYENLYSKLLSKAG